MECENKACIYWNDRQCSLEEVSIDYRGRCSECVILEEEDIKILFEREYGELCEDMSDIDFCDESGYYDE